MDFGTLTTQEKIDYANEMYQWYEGKYKMEIPKEEKDTFLMEACYDPNGLELFRQVRFIGRTYSLNVEDL